MATEIMKRKKYIQKRIKIQELIIEINTMLNDRVDEITRESMLKTRKALIEADNTINTFELKMVK